ncbi:hypothetical protein MRB53_040503 [Persea americana]|nr:hypothetical protein MRB53_040503 [Persea americana]
MIHSPRVVAIHGKGFYTPHTFPRNGPSSISIARQQEPLRSTQPSVSAHDHRLQAPRPMTLHTRGGSGPASCRIQHWTVPSQYSGAVERAEGHRRGVMLIRSSTAAAGQVASKRRWSSVCDLLRSSCGTRRMACHGRGLPTRVYSALTAANVRCSRVAHRAACPDRRELRAAYLADSWLDPCRDCRRELPKRAPDSHMTRPLVTRSFVSTSSVALSVLGGAATTAAASAHSVRVVFLFGLRGCWLAGAPFSSLFRRQCCASTAVHDFSTQRAPPRPQVRAWEPRVRSSSLSPSPLPAVPAAVPTWRTCVDGSSSAAVVCASDPFSGMSMREIDFLRATLSNPPRYRSLQSRLRYRPSRLGTRSRRRPIELSRECMTSSYTLKS